MDEVNACRICLDSSRPLISPCRCSGTASFLHSKCLQTWMESKTKDSKDYSCEICHYKYKVHWKDTYECRAPRTVGKWNFFTFIIVFEVLLGFLIYALATSQEVIGADPPHDIALGVVVGFVMIGLLVVFIKGFKEFCLVQVKTNWVISNYQGEELSGPSRSSDRDNNEKAYFCSEIKREDPLEG